MTVKPHNPISAAEKRGWQVVKLEACQGDGVQAPGYVVMTYTGGSSAIQYAVHFFNVQDGGFHGGQYCQGLPRAERVFFERVAHMTTHHRPWSDAVTHAGVLNAEEDDDG